ncbi:MAG: hypothetical protein R3240_12745 [Gammaproteobacteria bacterium]|nr:hypothetical protein [Gammaproteobacteria bacterium]
MNIQQLLKPNTYLSGAMVIGFLQIIDGVLGINNFRSSITTAFSLLELCWFIYSLIMTLNFRRLQLKILSPLMFVLYYFFSWLYGSYILYTQPMGEHFQLPDWFPWLASAFGASYLFVSYKSLKQLEAGNV